MGVCDARLLLCVSTRWSFAASLVIVDVSEVFGARDFGISGETAALTGVSFMGSRVRLRVHSDVAHLLSQGARIKLRDEATLFFLPDRHVTDGADIDHAIVGAAHVIEKTPNRWRILVAFSLGCIHGHRSENLGFLVLARL